MFKGRIKSKLHRLVAFTVLACMLIVSTAAAQIEGSDTWMEKIDAELWAVMAEKSDDDLIPVYLWLRSVEQDVITNALIAERGMDPAIYENEERFEEEIASEIARQIEERVGYEEAHKVEMPNLANEEENISDETEISEQVKSEDVSEVDEVFFDSSISLVDRAVSAKIDEYIMAKREITKREYSAVNDAFIAANIGNKQREIIYNSRYTSTLVVEATKAEIEAYAKKDIVEEISLYVELIPEPSLNIALGQIGADSSTGTKSSSFNGGSGYKGTGVKIGILEAGGGRYDSTAPQLSGVVKNSRLIYSNDAGVNGTAITATVSNHATMVTSIIIGQSVTVSSRTYEGIVPSATVYQTPTNTTADVNRGIQKLVDKGCSVINYSGNLETGTVYNSWDKEVDAIIYSTGVTFVVSAGNAGSGTTNIGSPAKALNVITVGNAETKSNATTANTSPYNMRASSSFAEASYLPNKPDITAPGTNISFVRSSGTVMTDSGTSYAAPLVTGVVAQIMQAKPILKTWSNRTIKGLLTCGADASQISTTNNASAGNHLREKSGAGLINAKNSVNMALNGTHMADYIFSGFHATSTVYTKSLGSVSAGKKIRIVVTFDKFHTGNINSQSDMDNVYVYLANSSGSAVASSTSNRNNVQIIEYTVPSTGSYTIQISANKVIDTNKGVFAALAYRIT